MLQLRCRSFKQHLDPTVGPKRILSLDGGGLRGVLTLGMLREIETVLRQRFDDPELLLADYFDLIGGTSTGAIIAAALSLSMTVDEVHAHYLKLGRAVFKRSLLRFGAIRAKFDADDVADALRSVLGERTLASKDFRTGLLVISKRLDTGSPWPLTNHPTSKYFGLRAGSRTIPNGEYPLWQVVRASTAAPHFFRPERIRISADDAERSLAAVHGDFVDGGVSPANNPALQCLMTATMDGFKFGWATGADKLLVVSVGTGKRDAALGSLSGIKASAGIHAVLSLAALMEDCSDLVETVMQWLSTSPTAREIDRETGTATPPLGGTPMLSYLRYNVLLDPDWCHKQLRGEWSAEELKALEAMDEPKNIPHLDALGRLAGSELVKAAHFGAAFDQGVKVAA